MKVLALTIVLLLCACHGHAERASAQEPVGVGKSTDPLQAYLEEALGRALDHVAVGYAYAIRRGGEPVAVGGKGLRTGTDCF